MKNTKRRIEPFSFFNHTGISRHLEKMAAKGWMLDKITNLGWIYRRMEPKTIHFAVSYYPKASEFDPEPTEGQKIFQDFCTHTGWALACTSAQMQIFYNEQENPTPIETEPELELEAIRASAKKSFVPAYMMLLVISILQGLMFVSNILGDPIALLSSPTKLFTGFCFLVLATLCMVELTCYFAWLSKARKAATHGEFLAPPNTAKFQSIILMAVFVGLAYWVITYAICGNNLQRWIAIAMCVYIPALFALVNGTKNALKRIKASRGINRTLTFLVSFIVSFGIMALITGVILWASSNGFFASEKEEIYEHGGMTWIAHNDELPLTIEDLTDLTYDGYIKERRGDESLLLGQFFLYQRPRFDAEDYNSIPTLEYTLTVIKAPFLYDMCKNRLIYKNTIVEHIRDDSYQAVDAAPWGADEVYRMHDPEYGFTNDYLLCYDKVIVEIRFDWEPTAEQMAIVAEKLGN